MNYYLHCNLNCGYCLYKRKKHFKAPLSLAEIYKLIDNWCEQKIDRLVLTGGEPTLHQYFVEISKYAISKIARVSVCTNGVILSSPLEDKIVHLNFSSYTISIDSHRADIHDKIRGCNGAFDQTVVFLEKLRCRNKNISIHITLHSHNLDYIDDTIEFFLKLANNIVVSTIYYDKHDKALTKHKAHYIETAEKILSKYSGHKDLVLVGFGESCSETHCLDQKNVFMVDQYGKIVDCYWKDCQQL